MKHHDHHVARYLDTDALGPERGAGTRDDAQLVALYRGVESLDQRRVAVARRRDDGVGIGGRILGAGRRTHTQRRQRDEAGKADR